MPSINFLNDTALEGISRQLSSWITDITPVDDAKVIVPHESIEICSVEVADLKDRSKNAKDCLKSTGSWHIQIFENDVPTYFARVSAPATALMDWSVNAFFQSQIAPQVDRGLDWIHDNVHDCSIVRLLEVPAFFITGFVLENDGDIRVFIVDKPAGLQIPAFQLMSFDQLREILITRPPVTGLNFLG